VTANAPASTGAALAGGAFIFAGPGYHLFYPSGRQSSAAFALVVEALRHRA
jgi:hypothetical protein